MGGLVLLGSIPSPPLGCGWIGVQGVMDMGTTYEKAGDEVVELVQEIMHQYHPELEAAQVTVDVLLAHADPDSDEPAVKAHGYPAAAVVRKIGLKDRVKGCADAEIVIDGDKIHEWSDRELRALIDHELTHLEPQRDNEGEFKTDDIGRPKLAIRLHDRQFGWFDVVARRWGLDSFESQQALEMVRDYDFAQLYLPGFDPLEIGSIKKEQLAESIEADRRNGETTPLFDSVEFRSSDMGLVGKVAGEFRKAGILR